MISASSHVFNFETQKSCLPCLHILCVYIYSCMVYICVCIQHQASSTQSISPSHVQLPNPFANQERNEMSTFHPEFTSQNQQRFSIQPAVHCLFKPPAFAESQLHNQYPPTSPESTIRQTWLRCSKCLMAAPSIENCSCGGTIFSSTTKPFPETLQEPQEPNVRNPGTSLGLVGLQPSNPIKETG